jgi:hypothetical protein
MKIQTTHLGIKARIMACRLRKLGCQVLAIKSTPKRPLIEIAYPTDDLRKNAVEIIEQVDGLRRRAYAARENGCIVHWRETTTRDEFERTADMAASEYMAYRAAGFPA